MTVITEQMRRVCKQHDRQEYVKITVLNKQNLEIAQIEGKTIDGNVSITNDSYLRRSASLKLKLDNELLPKQQSLIWTNKKCKIKIGIKDLLNDEIVWFPMGIFLYKGTQASYSSTERSLSLTLSDKMANFSGDINGEFLNDIKLSTQTTPIDESIRHIVTDLGGESNVLIESMVDDDNKTLMLPYTLTAKAGDKMLDSLKTLIEMYKYHTLYFDTDGIFVAEHTKTLLSDLISEDFRDIDFTINSQVTNDYSYIKNHIKIYGISVQPMVSVEDVESISNPTPVNNGQNLKILFNKPLYDSSGNRISDGANVKSCFQYNGTVSNFSSATYNNSDWSVTFVISGEQGKILKPVSNMIFDSSEIPFDDGGYSYSSVDGKWSRILVATILTDGINDTIQFELNFNKALYNSSGNPIVSGIDLKSSFYYADGSGNTNNFVSATYLINNGDYHITLSFTNPVENMTIQINKDGTSNSNSIYDSAGLIYRTENYIMNGTTWTKIIDDSSLITTYQITAELKNTDNTSPYSIDNIGEERTLVINDQNIYTKTQANLRCQWELQTHSNLNEQITISSLSLLYLDVNMLIYLYQPSLDIDSKYRIDKLGFDLKSGTMSVTCTKLYM
jgi:Phage late control gene D protein (GPD).